MLVRMTVGVVVGVYVAMLCAWRAWRAGAVRTGRVGGCRTIQVAHHRLARPLVHPLRRYGLQPRLINLNIHCVVELIQLLGPQIALAESHAVQMLLTHGAHAKGKQAWISERTAVPLDQPVTAEYVARRAKVRGSPRRAAELLAAHQNGVAWRKTWWRLFRGAVIVGDELRLKLTGLQVPFLAKQIRHRS
jgi:hypothetical protein